MGVIASRLVGVAIQELKCLSFCISEATRVESLYAVSHFAVAVVVIPLL
jgi:hypothetical protein